MSDVIYPSIPDSVLTESIEVMEYDVTPTSRKVRRHNPNDVLDAMDRVNTQKCRAAGSNRALRVRLARVI